MVRHGLCCRNWDSTGGDGSSFGHICDKLICYLLRLTSAGRNCQIDLKSTADIFSEGSDLSQTASDLPLRC
jgi:hypothetical protein